MQKPNTPLRFLLDCHVLSITMLSSQKVDQRNEGEKDNIDRLPRSRSEKTLREHVLRSDNCEPRNLDT